MMDAQLERLIPALRENGFIPGHVTRTRNSNATHRHLHRSVTAVTFSHKHPEVATATGAAIRCMDQAHLRSRAQGKTGTRLSNRDMVVWFSHEGFDAITAKQMSPVMSALANDGQVGRLLCRRDSGGQHPRHLFTHIDTVDEINAIDLLVALWFYYVSDDDKIDVGLLLDACDDPDGLSEVMRDARNGELSSAETTAAKVINNHNPERLRDIMFTVENHPEQFGLDRHDQLWQTIDQAVQPQRNAA